MDSMSADKEDDGKGGMIPRGPKIKVMHIITRFDKGGSAENTFLTVRDLDKDRYDVVLAVGGAPPVPSPGPSGDPEAAAIEAHIASLHGMGVRLVRLPRLVRELHPVSDLAALLSLVCLIRRERPVIVHTHTSKAGILGRWAAWLCRVPVLVHTPHGHVFWGYFGFWRTRLFVLLERGTAWITTALITLTEEEKTDHIRFRIAPAEKCTVIHSGVDLEPFSRVSAQRTPKGCGTAAASGFSTGFSVPWTGETGKEHRAVPGGTDGQAIQGIRERLAIPPATPLLATAGRLTAVKGQDTLIRAVAELRRRGEEVSLLILGEGELRRDLEALAARLGAEASVFFLGWRPDVAQVLAACDVFCLPSRNEGMGRVLVEAMALGKPIVASDIGGIRDLVSSGENGLLVPPGDVAAWAAALVRLHRDPEERRRMGEAGRRRAPRYSAEEMLRALDGLYRNLLRETSGGASCAKNGRHGRGGRAEKRRPVGREGWARRGSAGGQEGGKGWIGKS